MEFVARALPPASIALLVRHLVLECSFDQLGFWRWECLAWVCGCGFGSLTYAMMALIWAVVVEGHVG